jgi:hypothetical protein
MSIQANKGIHVPAADAPFSGPAAPLFAFAQSFAEALHNLEVQDLVFMDFETTAFQLVRRSKPAARFNSAWRASGGARWSNGSWST